eukprot:SAG22_NODE_229_length_14598_cov_13.257052_1_plen_1357_part_00
MLVPLVQAGLLLRPLLQLLLLAAAPITITAAEEGAPPPPRSVLFCTPSGPQEHGAQWVSYGYMQALLSNHSINVDFTSSIGELNRSRLSQYTALVLFETPAAALQRKFGEQGHGVGPAVAKAFPAAVKDFTSRGGGVMLFASDDDWYQQRLFDVAPLFDLTLPLETINETNPAFVGSVTNMATQERPLFYTDQVLAGHPLNEGVTGVWYPPAPHYNGADTSPLLLNSSAWTVLLRASATACTVATDLTALGVYRPLPPVVYQSKTPVCRPPLFAVRNFSLGRVAALSQWSQYTLGSGDGWLYSSQVLSRGDRGRKSDMGQLLLNVLSWLAMPTLGGPGGYVTPPDRLTPPNLTPVGQSIFTERTFEYNASALDGHLLGPTLPTTPMRTFRGIIGARTTFSRGYSSVADYAVAARKAKLDFVVFLDDWSVDGHTPTLSNATIAELARQCKQHSGPDLLLFPGYSITNNIGNQMMMLGSMVKAPPIDALTPDGVRFALADEPTAGNFSGKSNGAAFLWLLSAAYTQGKAQGWTVGYYHLGSTRAKGAMAMTDLRDFSMAGAIYYDSTGRLVEDLTGDFLQSSASGYTAVPAAISEVLSVSALITAANSQALTHVRAGNISGVFASGLTWNNQYAAPPVSVSSGPVIEEFTQLHMVYNLGDARFVTGNAMVTLPISVSATVPIADITLWNGQELFRRFKLPAHDPGLQFRRTLLLDGFVQKNLVLRVVDVYGRRAFSFPARMWKASPGTQSVVYCGDHVNAWPIAHGPMAPLAAWVNALPLDIAGATWDGGPVAQIPLLLFADSRPSLLASALGMEDGGRFYQTPFIEYSDEGSFAVMSAQSRVVASTVKKVLNEWQTYGPIGGPSKLFNFTMRFREFYPPSVGVPISNFAGMGLQRGNVVTLVRSVITFKVKNTISRMQILGGAERGLVSSLYVVVAANASSKPQTLCASALAATDVYKAAIVQGGWFGLWSTDASNSHLYFNRQQTIQIEVKRCPKGPECAFGWFRVMLPDADTGSTLLAVEAGSVRTTELSQVGVSLYSSANSTQDLQAIVDYIVSPTGLVIERGKRLLGGATAGLFEMELVDGMASLAIAQHPTDTEMSLPVRVCGWNPRWSGGLVQYKGYQLLGDAANTGGLGYQYTAVGVDNLGFAHAPLYSGLGATNVSIGHLVIADQPELFIATTLVNSNRTGAVQRSRVWHVSINNPTNTSMTTLLTTTLSTLPGLHVDLGPHRLASGEWRVVSIERPSSAMKTDDAATATAISNTTSAPDTLVFTFGENAAFPCFRVPGLVSSSNGTLLAFAEARRYTGDGCVPHKITATGTGSALAMKRSDDGGRTVSRTPTVTFHVVCLPRVSIVHT